MGKHRKAPINVCTNYQPYTPDFSHLLYSISTFSH
jgi:hypothetical protein